MPLKIKSSVTVPPEIRSIASRRMNIPSLPVLGLVDFVSVVFEVDLSLSAFVFLSPFFFELSSKLPGVEFVFVAIIPYSLK